MTAVFTQHWTELAACAGEDVDVFFPTSKGRNVYNAARAFCRDCPVRAACLEDAMEYELRILSRGGASSHLRHGMAGGLIPDERAKIHRAWNANRSPKPWQIERLFATLDEEAPRAAVTAEGHDRELGESPR